MEIIIAITLRVIHFYRHPEDHLPFFMQPPRANALNSLPLLDKVNQSLLTIGKKVAGRISDGKLA